MRLTFAGVLCLFVAAACSSPYRDPAEKLVMPKKKKAKEKPEGPIALEPDACKADFTANATKISNKTRNTATGLAQDADNQLAGIESPTLPKEQKKEMVLQSLSTSTSALRSDPYNPAATFEMAVAYGWAGKKKCAIMMLERLIELSKHPDVVDEASRFAGKVKKHPAFNTFRKEADGALGQ
jgi:hypothetical protein